MNSDFEKFYDTYKSFFKVLTIEIGLKCPITCQHCLHECGPDRTEQMEISMLKHTISQFDKIEGSEIILLTGGEPFAYPVHLTSALGTIHKSSHLKSGVITNGFWATSRKKALETLKGLPHINQLFISTDVYHEKFVPIENIRNALLACHEVGISTCLQVCTSNDSIYLEKLRRALGANLLKQTHLWVSRLQAIGRGTNLTIEEEKIENKNAWDACWVAGSPFLLCDGTATMCCGLAVRKYIGKKLVQTYNFGNIQKRTLKELFTEMNNDVIVQGLRTMGVGGIWKLLQSNTATFNEKIPVKGDICDLCFDILTNQQAVSILRGLLESDSCREKMKLKRLYYYGESAK